VAERDGIGGGDFRIGPVPSPVRATDLKPFDGLISPYCGVVDGLRAGHETRTRIVEGNGDGASVQRVTPVERATRDDVVDAVCLIKSPESKSVPYIDFITRVYIPGFTHIVQYGHSSVCSLKSEALLVLNCCPCISLYRRSSESFIVRELCKVEREISLPPGTAPRLNQA